MPTINLGKRKPHDESGTNRKINKSRYNTPDWIALKKAKLLLNPVCEKCNDAQANGITHNKKYYPTNGPIDEAFYNIDSVISTCHQCQIDEHIRLRKEAGRIK